MAYILRSFGFRQMESFPFHLMNFFITKSAKKLESCTELANSKLLLHFFGGELALAISQKHVRKAYQIVEIILKSNIYSFI